MTTDNSAALAVHKKLLLEKKPEFFDRLDSESRKPIDFNQLFYLNTLRKRASSMGLVRATEKRASRKEVRIAFLGGYSLYPLHELVEHLLFTEGFDAQVFVGEYDNYINEMLDENSDLYRFKPTAIVLFPAARRCYYGGTLADDPDLHRTAAQQIAKDLLNLADTVHRRLGSEIFLINFRLPAGRDLGAYRSRSLGSDWNFTKLVNLELGLNAPPFVTICDIEFLANRNGGLWARDDKGWFETKQPCSPDLLVEVAREITHLAKGLREPPKKVLVLDLDNTLWGGVVGDDGFDGIEIGSTSARGESFRAFQTYIKSLKKRGVLLAVCSKNDYDKARRSHGPTI